MITTKQFTGARRWGWRNGTARQTRRALREIQQTHGTARSVRVHLDGDVPTGCWRLDGRVHRIKIGEKFDECLAVGMKTPAKVKQALQSLITHEACHGLYTSTDGTYCAEEMARRGLPFRIFNVFEDIRIEDIYRNDPAHDGFKFRWDALFGREAEYTRATDYLLALSHREASAFGSMSAAAAPLNWTGTPVITGTGTRYDGKRTHLVIREFYTAATKCGTARDLMPVVQEWCDVFGMDKPDHVTVLDEIDGKADPTADATDARTPSSSTGGTADDDGSFADASGQIEAAQEMGANPAEGLTPNETAALDRYQRRAPLNANEDDVRRITRAISQIRHNADHVAAEISTRGPAIHIGGVMTGSAQSFKNYTVTTGSRTVTVIIDFSGSMGTTWCKFGGLEFILALRQLHQRGELDVRLYITSTAGAVRVPLARISERDVRRLSPVGGAEGFAATLARADVQADMEESSVTIAWTDGMICSGDVDARPLRRKGIDIIGAAPRPDDTAVGGKTHTNILRHFGKGFVGHGVELARRIANYIINRPTE